MAQRETDVHLLPDVIADPDEKKNLLGSEHPDAMKALKKFKAAITSLPETDAHPTYEPQPAAWNDTGKKR